MDLEVRTPLDYEDWGEIIREITDQGFSLSMVAYHLDMSVGYLSMLQSGRKGGQLSYPAGKRLLEIHEELCGG